MSFLEDVGKILGHAGGLVATGVTGGLIPPGLVGGLVSTGIDALDAMNEEPAGTTSGGTATYTQQQVINYLQQNGIRTAGMPVRNSWTQAQINAYVSQAQQVSYVRGNTRSNYTPNENGYSRANSQSTNQVSGRRSGYIFGVKIWEFAVGAVMLLIFTIITIFTFKKIK